ncbi:MgtC/SapB family protein [Cohnella silvisoli]|uniref:MgtC/SapB family protein n=2 Tax=Cohnella silvisoli TaxID=2873699 RepID=A0ABV1KMN2_9BACL|nr:MgtC/SapB family protein [Cohnella silvisoli]
MSDVWHITHTEMVLRLLCATTLGGLIGLEREWNNHAAGFRTHILVCIGSTMIMLLSIYGFAEFVNEGSVRMDPARLAAQVISGIGFLGAGAILRNGSSVSGLTTAASIWVVAAIGLCVGAGFYFVSAVSTLFVLVSLFVLNKLEKHWMHRRRAQEIVIKVNFHTGSIGRIVSAFEEHRISLNKFYMKPDEKSNEAAGVKQVMDLHFSFKNPNSEKLLLAIETISTMVDVISLHTHHQLNAKRMKEQIA